MSNQFENTARAEKQIDRIRQAASTVDCSKFFSALYKTNGESYRLCNLVLQGGGTLGIAHLGFLRGLEIANVRFAGLAGTSAGAIVALLIAAARKDALEEEVAERLVPILQTMPAAAFMDGPYLARRFVKFALEKRRSGFLEYALPALASVRQLLSRYGLNRGYRFEDWLAQVLSRSFDLDTQQQLDVLLKNVHEKLRRKVRVVADPEQHSRVARSTSQLDQRRRSIRRLDIGQTSTKSSKLLLLRGTQRSSIDRPSIENSHLRLLHITATAMPLGLKIVFPKHAALFHSKYVSRSPALFARASMSVPLFFEPLEIDLSQTDWGNFLREPDKADAYSNEVINSMRQLRALSFVDGGLLSNFPIDAFLDNEVCGRIPTVGVALVSAHVSYSSAPRGSAAAFAGFAGATVNAMRHLRDREGLARAKQLEQVSGKGTKVAFVDTGPHNWLNFNLPADDMRDLYIRGLAGCADFLERLSRLETGNAQTDCV